MKFIYINSNKISKMGKKQLAFSHLRNVRLKKYFIFIFSFFFRSFLMAPLSIWCAPGNCLSCQYPEPALLRDKLMNEKIKRKANNLNKWKIHEIRLRWYGHVLWKNDSKVVKKAWNKQVKGKRSRGRQRLRWRHTIKNNLKIKGITEKDTKERERWR